MHEAHVECALTSTFRFVLHKRDPRTAEGGAIVAYPRAETPDAYIAMGFDDDLSNATRKALRNIEQIRSCRRDLTLYATD